MQSDSSEEMSPCQLNIKRFVDAVSPFLYPDERDAALSGLTCAESPNQAAECVRKYVGITLQRVIAGYSRWNLRPEDVDIYPCSEFYSFLLALPFVSQQMNYQIVAEFMMTAVDTLSELQEHLIERFIETRTVPASSSECCVCMDSETTCYVLQTCPETITTPEGLRRRHGTGHCKECTAEMIVRTCTHADTTLKCPVCFTSWHKRVGEFDKFELDPITTATQNLTMALSDTADTCLQQIVDYPDNPTRQNGFSKFVMESAAEYEETLQRLTNSVSSATKLFFEKWCLLDIMIQATVYHAKTVWIPYFGIITRLLIPNGEDLSKQMNYFRRHNDTVVGGLIACWDKIACLDMTLAVDPCVQQDKDGMCFVQKWSCVEQVIDMIRSVTAAKEKALLKLASNVGEPVPLAELSKDNDHVANNTRKRTRHYFELVCGCDAKECDVVLKSKQEETYVCEQCLQQKCFEVLMGDPRNPALLELLYGAIKIPEMGSFEYRGVWGENNPEASI